MVPCPAEVRSARCLAADRRGCVREAGRGGGRGRCRGGCGAAGSGTEVREVWAGSGGGPGVVGGGAGARWREAGAVARADVRIRTRRSSTCHGTRGAARDRSGGTCRSAACGDTPGWSRRTRRSAVRGDTPGLSRRSTTRGTTPDRSRRTRRSTTRGTIPDRSGRSRRSAARFRGRTATWHRPCRALDRAGRGLGGRVVGGACRRVRVAVAARGPDGPRGDGGVARFRAHAPPASSCPCRCTGHGRPRRPARRGLVVTGHAYPYERSAIPAQHRGRNHLAVPPFVRVTLRAAPVPAGTGPRAQGDLPGTSPYPAVIRSGRLRP